jgi:hypothetical protein
MFFYQRKAEHVETRTIKLRDEWGELHEFEVIKITLEPEDQRTQRECQTSVIWRRID